MRILAATILAILIGTPAAAQPGKVLKLPEPSGQYHVGTQSFYWQNKAEDEIATPELDQRDFYVQVWYPANVSSGNKKSEYIPAAAAFGAMVGPQTLSRFKRTQTNSYTGAPVATGEKSYPVILFSPGFGMSKYYYT